MPILKRRHFLAGASLALIMPMPALAKAEVRSLAFDNIHTGEKLRVDYWANGDYVPDALSAVNNVLRDFRTSQVHPIAPSLLDLLASLRAQLDTSAPLSIISGYRSPVTNAMLRGGHQNSGVATKSLHMQGKAVDIRIAGRPLPLVRKAALSLRGGGVGYYPSSDFVHVDIGRVRTW